MNSYLPELMTAFAARARDKAAAVLSEAYKHLSRKVFKELENYIFEKLR